jgi:hypothetical protein
VLEKALMALYPTSWEGQMDNHTHLGYWWLPDDPDAGVFGVLHAPPNERMLLSTAGTLAPSGTTNLTIHGRTHEGEPVTLAGCLAVSERHPLTSDLYTGFGEYEVAQTLLGDHFALPDEARFKFMDVAYSGLAAWIGTAIAKWVSPVPESYQCAIGIPYEDLPSVRHADVEIVFCLAAQRNQIEGASTLEPVGHAMFTSETPLTLKAWDDQFIRPIGNLISFALDQTCFVLEQSANERGPLWGDAQKGHDIVEVRVLNREPVKGSGRHPDRPRFLLSDSEVDLRVSLPRWLDACSAIKLPIDLYFAAMHAPFIYIEASFLTLIQCAEGYHRARFPDYVEEKPDVHARRLKTIYEALEGEAECVTWLKKQLGTWSNEPALASRLKDLGDLAIGLGLPTTSRQLKSFIYHAKNARHHLSHGGLLADEAASYDVWPLYAELSAIMQACLMRELELPASTVRRALSENAFGKRRQASAS